MTRSPDSSSSASPPRPVAFPWTRLILVVALLGLLANAWIPLKTFVDLEAERTAYAESRERLDLLNAILLDMVDTETGERGFIITGDSDFLAPYHLALASVRQRMATMESLHAETGLARSNWEALKARITASQAFIHSAIETRQRDGFGKAMQMVESGEGRRRMDAVRAAAAALIDAEKRQSTLSMARAAEHVALAKRLVLGLTAFAIALFAYAFWLLRKTIVADRRRERALRALHEDLTHKAEQLGEAQRVQHLQSSLVNLLQAVLDLPEAYQLIGKFCAQIFQRHAGAFYVRSNSRDHFERVAVWGTPNPSTEGFEPAACWAARSGHQYRFDSPELALACRHVVEEELPHLAYLCVPMSSNGEMTGLLTLFGEHDAEGRHAPVSAMDELLAAEVVEKIGLAVANIRLRDSLRHSSIIDPLTGLYNRRYFEETLRRELGRAERAGTPVGVMMLDVDHFKRFNDRFGHDAGDLVLREAARVLKSAGRRSDFACRFGGEEFIMVMPEAGMETLRARAESIRTAIKAVSVSYGGRNLGAITISIGLAAFPEHGGTIEELVRAADEALYRAKDNGRDQVVVAGEHPPTLAESLPVWPAA